MDCGYCSVHFRRLVGVGVITAFLATALVPAMAASQAQPTDSNSNAFSEKSIAKIVANTKPARVRDDAASRGKDDAPKTPAQAGRSASFFKTPTGVAVLIAMAVGTGYAIRSASKDRIHGSAR